MQANKVLFLFVVFFCCQSSFAKKVTFDSTRGLSFGLISGITTNPFINYIPEPLSYKHGFTHYLGISPQISLGKIALQALGSVSFHPSMTGRGSESSRGSFQESAESQSIAAQGRVLFFPVPRTDTARWYMGLGYGTSRANLTNKRKYDTGPAFTEKLTGASEILTAFVGGEKFLIQNYAGSLELGYRNHYIGKLMYAGDEDSSGAVQTKGSPKTYRGRDAFFVSRGFYLQASITLHL